MYIYIVFFFIISQNIYRTLECSKALVVLLSFYWINVSQLRSIFVHIGRLARMSVLDTEVDGSNPGSSMLFP